MTGGSIRLMVVDDHEVVRAGLCALFEGVERVDLVAEAATGAEAVALAAEQRPDVTLLDLRLNGESGLDVCRTLLAAHPSMRVILLTAYADSLAAAEAIQAGAAGFLLKRASGQSLVRAVKGTDRTEMILDRDIARSMLAQASRPVLLDWELQLAELLANGLTNPEIARRVGQPVATVKAQVSRLLLRLGVDHRAEVPARVAELTGSALRGFEPSTAG